MKYTLLCKQTTKELGIVDENGLLDPSKFHQHVEECPICLDFMEKLVEFIKQNKEDKKINAS
ncbi:hypothetical protein LCGC14_0817720 [marine sediment metagenome]|uniref:Uncharacterized protein n=1 Tax=marine sediment metagenome TaxID=412755 RepID=A0A0F9SS68_9ZZZZ|nr:hypothetical protein [Desulfobacterales bacterium]